MKFCPECGNKIDGMKFCLECGYKITISISEPSEVSLITIQSTQAVSGNQTTTQLNEEILREGKQSILFSLNDKLRYKATNSIELK